MGMAMACILALTGSAAYNKNCPIFSTPLALYPPLPFARPALWLVKMLLQMATLKCRTGGLGNAPTLAAKMKAWALPFKEKTMVMPRALWVAMKFGKLLTYSPITLTNLALGYAHQIISATVTLEHANLTGPM